MASRSCRIALSAFVIALQILIVGAAEVAVDSTDADTASSVVDDSSNNRVFGGRDAQNGRYPYIAHVYNKDDRSYCAGTLITPDTILSAAHCADEDSVPSYVIIGKHSRLDYASEAGVEKIGVKEVILHPDHRDGFDWINDHVMNDIVLFKLKGSSRQTPVKVNFNSDLPNTYNVKQLRVMGWGTLNYDRERPDELQVADVEYVSNYVCSQSKGKIRPTSTYERSYKGYITEDMLCAASPGRDACAGDSGGPLIIPGYSAAQDVQVGVVSWGYGCASENFPGVYARLDIQADYIHGELCNDNDSYQPLCSQNPPPTPRPSLRPTRNPTRRPTRSPTAKPNPAPSTRSPTPRPSPSPTKRPSKAPTDPYVAPDLILPTVIGSNDWDDLMEKRPEILTVEIQFDDKPSDVGWSIQPAIKNPTQAALVTRNIGEYSRMKGGEVVTETVPLNANDPTLYTFILVDQEGDGMTSGTPGRYTIYAGEKEDGNVVAQGGGEYNLATMAILSTANVALGRNDGGFGEEAVLEYIASKEEMAGGGRRRRKLA